MAIPEGLATYAWVAACAVVAPTVLGLGLVRALGLLPQHGRRLGLAFAWLTGQYLLAHVTLLWLIAKKPVPGAVLPLAAAAAGTALLLWQRRRRPASPPGPWWSWLPVLLLSLVLCDGFLAANTQPIRIGDEADIWTAKAKVLFGSPGFDVGFGLHFVGAHADYPMFDPLIQVLAFASAGRVLQFENRLPIQCFGIALLLLLSAATTRRCHPLAAAAALFAFAGTTFANSVDTCAADVMLAFATLAVVEALLRWRETGERVWWRLGCIATAAMLFSKNEGSLLALAVTLPFLLGWLCDRAQRTAPWPGRDLLWLSVPAAAVFLHHGFNAWFGCVNDLFDPAVGGGHGLFGRIAENLSSRLLPVAGFYGGMLVDLPQQRLLVLSFLLAFPLAAALAGRRYLLGPEARLFGAVLLALCGYMLVFVGTHAQLQWHMLTAADRTVLHVLPVAALGLCLCIWPLQPAGALAWSGVRA